MSRIPRNLRIVMYGGVILLVIGIIWSRTTSNFSRKDEIQVKVSNHLGSKPSTNTDQRAGELQRNERAHSSELQRNERAHSSTVGCLRWSSKGRLMVKD